MRKWIISQLVLTSNLNNERFLLHSEIGSSIKLEIAIHSVNTSQAHNNNLITKVQERVA